MDYLLEQRLDDKTPIRIELSSTEVILGSDYIAALKSYSKVSKSHARLNFHNGSWYIEDLRSTYGVFLDSEKIGKNPKKVQNWGVIGLGGTFNNDDVFICTLCPVKKIKLKRDCSDKDLSKNETNRKVRKKPHSKDKLSSNSNLYSDHSGKNVSNFKLDHEANELSPSPQSNESIGTNSNNRSDSNSKVGQYLETKWGNSLRGTNLEKKDNFYLQDESPTEHMHCDDDDQSTSSSVEIMDKIMYPSELVLLQIQKSKNNMQSSCEEKVQQSCSVDRHKSRKNDNLRRSTSSVESLDSIKYPSESVLSEIQKSKQSKKRSVNSDNEQLHSSAKLVKMSKSVNFKSKSKNKPGCKTSKNDNNMQLSSQKNGSQNCSSDEVKKVQKNKSLLRHSKTKSIDNNIQLSSQKNGSQNCSSDEVKKVQKNKSLLRHSETKSIDNNIQLSSQKNGSQNCTSDEVKKVQKNKSLLRHSETKSIDNNIQLSSQKNGSQNCSSDEVKKVQKNKSLLRHSKTKNINSPKRSEKKSIKEFKIPRLSNKKDINTTMLSKCSSEVNLSVLNNSDECPGNISTKKPTVKKRSDDYGSHMKPLKQDVSDPTEKYIKQTKITKSIQSQEIKKGNLRSSVRSQIPCEATTSVINNCAKQNSLKEFKSSISGKCPKLAENEKANVAAKTTPNLDLREPAKNLASNLSVPHRSEKVCEKIKSNESNLKIPVPLESEKLKKNPCMIKANSHLLHTHLQSSEYEVTQMDSSSSVSSEFTEHLDKNSQKELYSLVPISSESNSINCSELMSKHGSNAGPSVKSSTKCSRSSFAETVSTRSRNNCYYELIKKIVEMNPKWLHEKEKIKVPPSSVTSGAGQLPLSFDSYDKYVNSFLQMILLEVWETLCLTSEPYLKSESENFYFSVLSSHYVHGLMKLQCESVVNEDNSFSPHNNSLVILDLKEDKEITCLPTFGLIINVNTEPLDIECMNTRQWKNFPEEWLQNARVWKFDVYVKSREIAIAKRCVMKGFGICNLEDKINLTDALSSLKHSPMVNCILSPDWATFSVECDISHSNDYMTIQNDISHAVFNEMTLPDDEKKIILLEGPPGSGKTEVIARVCQKLIENVPKTFKILVTAPSHFAVDNIANQMIELNRRLGSEDIKFIRTGEKHFIDREHLKYSLCEKLDYRKKKIDLERERIHKKIDTYQTMSPKDRRRKEIIEKEAELDLKLKTTKWDEMHERCAILNDTNIVLSTFSDCFDLYETKINFSCCILDEANQATEPDTLFPFMFKNSKYFILGDTKQLPPIVKSELAIKYGFERSILERFQAYFMKKCKKSPAIQLKMQFRMHGDISIFPLRTFYFKDYNPPQYSYSFKKWFLEPYIVLDDMRVQGNSSNDNTGCSVIKSLCSSIIQHDPVCSTAIIVPSDLQKDLYMSALALCFPTIKVCTIDNIQGQEKSICILSCYQGSTSNETFNKLFSCKRRLNVALTRASHCLIICGPLHLLERLPCWNALLKDAKARKCYIPFSHSDNIFKIFEEKILKN